MSKYRIGIASTDITPGADTQLYALEGKRRTSEKVLDPLFVTAMCIDTCGGELAFVVSVDIIWLSTEFCDRARREMTRLFATPDGNVFIAATHTHASPQMLEKSRNPAPLDFAYERELMEALLTSATAARTAMSPAVIKVGRIHCPVAVYRRKTIPDPAMIKRFRWQTMVANRPVPEQCIDDVLTCIRIEDENGELRAVLLNLACHPTLIRADAVSADYPGRIRQQLKARYGNHVATLFLQGFSGNLKPAFYKRNRFSWADPFRSAYSLVFDRLQFCKDTGAPELEIVASKVLACLENAAYTVVAVNGIGIKSHLARIELTELAQGESVDLRLHALRLFDDLVLVGISGEVFMEYGLWLRRILPGVVPVGCCGGMEGYIPDQEALDRGGYEVDRSLDDFGRRARFADGVEEKVKRTIRESMIRVSVALMEAE